MLHLVVNTVERGHSGLLRKTMLKVVETLSTELPQIQNLVHFIKTIRKCTAFLRLTKGSITTRNIRYQPGIFLLQTAF